MTLQEAMTYLEGLGFTFEEFLGKYFVYNEGKHYYTKPQTPDSLISLALQYKASRNWE